MARTSKKKLWFKNKRYGWGWYPATWQGWVSLLVFIIAFGIGELWFVSETTSETFNEIDLFFYLTYMATITALLITLCYRTGEKPGWHWGNEKK